MSLFVRGIKGEEINKTILNYSFNIKCMLKIFKYSFYDLLRSRWLLMYFLFFLATTFALLYLSSDISKGIVSLMNIIIAIIPVISIIFGVMYYYNSREFIDLLLSQPIKRKSVFLGQFLGLSLSLALSFVLGMIIPFAVYGIFTSSEIWNFSSLLFIGVILTLIFVSLAYLISILNDDKIKGFGIAILVWILFSVIYDGALLLFFVSFSDYPLQKFAIVLTVLNPVDLARVMVLLKLDVSALMGYTGAVFNQFFGTTWGMFISSFSLLLWIFIPLFSFLRIIKKKDF